MIYAAVASFVVSPLVNYTTDPELDHIFWIGQIDWSQS